MKFTATLTSFHKVIQKVLPAMPRKSTLPVLENFNFILTGNELRIVATDQEITIMSKLEVEGEEDGSILVPGRRINEIVKALGETGNLSFASDDTTYEITIRTATGKYGMKGEDTQEYLALRELFESEKPPINIEDGSFVPAAGKTAAAFFKKDAIVNLTEKTVFAVSADEYRPAMTGVLFQFKGNHVNAVATDSFRLCKVVHRTENEIYPDDMNIIIPARAADLLKKSDDDVIFSFIRTMDKITHIRFDIGETVIISRIIDEKFPPYENVIPLESSFVASIPYKKAISAIKRAAIFTSKVNHQVKLNFNEQTLTIFSEDEETFSNATELIECEYTGEDTVIAFNCIYLEQAISNIDGDDENLKFVITFSEQARPVLIKRTLEDNDLVMLIMPVRLN